MKRTIHSILRLVATALGALWCEVQPAQSQDRAFANPPMSSRPSRLESLVAAPGTYTIDGHQFQGMLEDARRWVRPVISRDHADRRTVVDQDRSTRDAAVAAWYVSLAKADRGRGHGRHTETVDPSSGTRRPGLREAA